jgi:hypothetical protein
MSYAIADPELLASAASDLASIGSNASAAHMAVALFSDAALAQQHPLTPVVTGARYGS